MTFQLTRAQALEFAWSRPMRELARSVGVSDVALAKSLRESGIPTPPRGYWNKLAAGKKVVRAKLSEPDLGTPANVWISGDLGAARSFVTGEPGVEEAPVDTDRLAERFRQRIGKLGVPPLNKQHPDVARVVAREVARGIWTAG